LHFDDDDDDEMDGKVDVPKSGDDMIFIAFHYGHQGGGGDNPDFNPIQIALVLAHHHA